MNRTEPPALPATPNPGHWGIGIGLSVLCIVMVIPLALAASIIGGQFSHEGAYLGLAVAAAFGLSQWLFVVPVGLYLRHRGKTGTAMGLWISAGIAVLLNGACFVLMWMS